VPAATAYVDSTHASWLQADLKALTASCHPQGWEQTDSQACGLELAALLRAPKTSCTLQTEPRADPLRKTWQIAGDDTHTQDTICACNMCFCAIKTYDAISMLQSAGAYRCHLISAASQRQAVA
jgi:hypothetical protein